MKPLTRIVALALGAGAGLLAVPAGAQEVRNTETHPNRSMMTSGIFAFGVPYVASVVVAAGSSHPGDHDLYVPVAGPWMDLADRHCPEGASPCNHEVLYQGLLVVDGIFQGVGALDIIGAFLFPETTTVTSAKAATTPTHVASTAPVTRFRLAPSIGNASGYGLVAVGAF